VPALPGSAGNLLANQRGELNENLFDELQGQTFCAHWKRRRFGGIYLLGRTVLARAQGVGFSVEEFVTNYPKWGRLRGAAGPCPRGHQGTKDSLIELSLTVGRRAGSWNAAASLTKS